MCLKMFLISGHHFQTFVGLMGKRSFEQQGKDYSSSNSLKNNCNSRGILPGNSRCHPLQEPRELRRRSKMSFLSITPNSNNYFAFLLSLSIISITFFNGSSFSTLRPLALKQSYNLSYGSDCNISLAYKKCQV